MLGVLNCLQMSWYDKSMQQMWHKRNFSNKYIFIYTVNIYPYVYTYLNLFSFNRKAIQQSCGNEYRTMCNRQLSAR